MSRSISLLLILLFAISYFKFIHKTDNIQSLPSTINASVFRDNEGVPHIFAQKQKDLFFGLGYAEAQDRLWALYIKKFLLQGRLSELFGRGALSSDYFARNFKFHDVGVMNAKLLDPQTRQKAQAYCDGINHYARSVKFLPLEFYIFWLQWQDWSIENTLGLLAFSSFSLQFDWMYQIARQRLLETVGFDLAQQIINFGSGTLFRETTIMKEDELKKANQWQQYDPKKQVQILKQHWANKKTSLGSIHLPTFEFQGSGSNAWVIGGQHTANGRPLLANDPHLGLLAPPAFYVLELGLLDSNNQVRIQTFGASMSGVPGISIGVNKLGAWGSTASYVDNKDLYYETVKVTQGVFQYLHEGQWKNFSQNLEKFKIRWQGQQNRTFYENHRGPVVEQIFDELYYKYSYPMPLKYRLNHTITLAAAIYDPDPSSLAGLTSIAFCQNYTSFRNSSQNVNAPNIDSVYINATGDYGYSAVGRIPLREVDEMSGFMKDGTVSIYDMKGYIPNKQKPLVANPQKGYVAMCNNKFAPDQFKYRSSLHQITTGRAYRLEKIITEKISQGLKFTHEDMKKMQLDVKDQFLSQAFPHILNRLQSLRYIWSNAKTEKMYALLKKWDYVMEKNSVQTTIYHVWERLLQSSFLQGSGLNEQQREAIINHAFFENYQFRLFKKIGRQQLGSAEAKICQNSQTKNYTNLHSCQASVALAFKRLPQELIKLFNSDTLEDYQWGKIHQATFKSVPFSDLPLINRFWQRKTPSGGNSRSLNVAILTHQVKGEQKYRSVAGPVFRFITDLETTYWSLDLGNSAQITSPTYDNFLGTDRYVEYKPENPFKKMPENWRLVAENKENTKDEM